MIRPVDVPAALVHRTGSVRIVRSAYSPIDHFEDIAEPDDWRLLISAEQKTNRRLMDSIGNLDLVSPGRRVGGPGASYLMAPFTRTRPDRPSRLSDGRPGVLHVAGDFETAVHGTIHHHGRFMAATKQDPGWTAQFRELVLGVEGDLEDLRETRVATLRDPDDYGPVQAGLRGGRSCRGRAGKSLSGRPGRRGLRRAVFSRPCTVTHAAPASGLSWERGNGRPGPGCVRQNGLPGGWRASTRRHEAVPAPTTVH